MFCKHDQCQEFYWQIVHKPAAVNDSGSVQTEHEECVS